MGNRIFAFRLTALGLAAAVSLTSLPLPALAAMVSTESAIAGRPAAAAPDAETTRAVLRASLEDLGIDPAEAEARVVALSDAEIAALSQRIAELPVGAQQNPDDNTTANVLLVLIIVAYVAVPVILLLLIFA